MRHARWFMYYRVAPGDPVEILKVEVDGVGLSRPCTKGTCPRAAFNIFMEKFDNRINNVYYREIDTLFVKSYYGGRFGWDGNGMIDDVEQIPLV